MKTYKFDFSSFYKELFIWKIVLAGIVLYFIFFQVSNRGFSPSNNFFNVPRNSNEVKFPQINYLLFYGFAIFLMSSTIQHALHFFDAMIIVRRKNKWFRYFSLYGTLTIFSISYVIVLITWVYLFAVGVQNIYFLLKLALTLFSSLMVVHALIILINSVWTGFIGESIAIFIMFIAGFKGNDFALFVSSTEHLQLVVTMNFSYFIVFFFIGYQLFKRKDILNKGE